ncbi:protoporphyrinogen oxidase [Saccharibacillus sp. CPCC 101409]|uniref:protoporphyrinogen oxidase n=1 Tax=Saccharibacillus sp. CPCC 101409 TaxID=3058041 RepID=UPI0026721CEB|nr:protoporphyrinogen oxidase [Saccharibacillus sp. CPCC 101409]MDO3408971.1 protoporphyrinogen oxidase [Saccharibacillus sp. CPCC 101409]
MGEQRRVVVIGGGLTGLSAAFYTRKFLREAGFEPVVTVLERSGSWGGKIETLHKDGFVIEKGPDSFLARKTAMTDLAKELELDHDLVSTNPNAKKTYLLHKGKLHEMPAGLVLGIPTQIRPFLSSKLVSPAGKIRALMDYVLPPKRGGEDESLGHFIERRLGSEVLENVTEPLLAGIYAGETRHLSLQSTFPQFGAVEREYGSLIRGMMTGRKPAETHTGTKKSAFLTFRQGLQSLVHALVNELGGAVDLRSGTGASSIVKEPQGGYTIELEDGTMLGADSVIVTVPTFAASKLLSPHVDTAALDEIDYVSVANVVLAFDKKDIKTAFDGSGFLVPRKEGRTITACTWTSAKWLHTSADDKVLMRCYVGRAGEQEALKQDDAGLVELVRKDILDLMGIGAQPLFTEVTRLNHSMPQYPVGHVQHIAGLRAELSVKLPGVYIAGAGYDGVGLPDCIRQAKEISAELAAAAQAVPAAVPV